MEIIDVKMEVVDEPKNPIYLDKVPEEGEVHETTGDKIIKILLKVRP